MQQNGVTFANITLKVGNNEKNSSHNAADKRKRQKKKTRRTTHVKRDDKL